MTIISKPVARRAARAAAGLAFLGATLGAASHAEAACNPPGGVNSTPNATTGIYPTTTSQRPWESLTEDAVYDDFICNAEFSSENWNRYSMDESNWDDGRGFTNYCDATRMLGKTYVSYWMMLFSSSTPPTTWDDYNGNILRWGAPWATDNIDEMDGQCSWGKFGYTQWGLQDNLTEIWLDAIYMATPVARAGTILHEARHAHGGDSAQHDGNDGAVKCVGGGESCDESFSQTWTGRANSIQVWWLSWYFSSGINTANMQRNWARTRGNWILDNRFDAVPAFNI